MARDPRPRVRPARRAVPAARRAEAVLCWKATGTFSGPLEPPGFAPTNARLAFDGFDLHEYQDGLVSRLQIILDMADISRQAGLLPKQGPGTEKAGASARRLAMTVRNRLRR